MLDPDRYLVAAFAQNEWVTSDGLYLTDDAGRHWEHVNTNEDISLGLKGNNDIDVYFSVGAGILCSSDYGKTWNANRAGLDENNDQFNIMNTGDKLLGTDYRYIYEYQDSIWCKLNGERGVPLDLTSISGGRRNWIAGYDLDYDELFVYFSEPNRGLYRSVCVETATYIGGHGNGGDAHKVEVYPHPASGDLVIISWGEAMSGYTVINIYDLHGRKIQKLLTQRGDKSASWNCRDTMGKKVKTGVYFIEIISDCRCMRRAVVLQ
jgi:hypothetical protein